MKNVLWVSILLLFLPSMASAFECNPNGNQSEMNRCAADDFEKADKELNQVYQALIKKSKDDKNYIEKLRASQRLWVKFRDAEVEAMFACEDENKRLCWGSMYGLLYSSAMEELTRERIKRLKSYLDEGQNPSVGGG